MSLISPISSLIVIVQRCLLMVFMLTQLLLILLLLLNDNNHLPSWIIASRTRVLVEAGKKEKDEHLFLHMPEGGAKVILPIPLFIPLPFP